MNGLTSGPHMGVIHRWIKWRFHNGSYVTWGSHEQLQTGRTLTVDELERLAQEIRDAVLEEVITAKQLGDSASEVCRLTHEDISVKYSNFTCQCSIGSKKSSEYIGLEAGLRWLHRQLIKILCQKDQPAEEAGGKSE